VGTSILEIPSSRQGTMHLTIRNHKNPIERLTFGSRAEGRAWLCGSASKAVTNALAAVVDSWSNLPPTIAEPVERQSLDAVRAEINELESIVGTINEVAFVERAQAVFMASVEMWFEVIARLGDPVDDALDDCIDDQCPAIDRQPPFERLDAQASQVATAIEDLRR
jgi:hypothetical protein